MLFTASWTTLHRASTHAELPVQPVRISRGVPRFWLAAKSFAAIPELMPPGWVFAVFQTDPERARRAYRRGLDVLGIDRVTRLLDSAADDPERPLALCCFEPNPADCHRGPHGFAGWWKGKTGEPIRDLSFAFNLTTGAPALVSESTKGSDAR
jgi:hypothetical protein